MSGTDWKHKASVVPHRQSEYSCLNGDAIVMYLGKM